MPLAGRVREMVYVPGRRWAVNRRTVRTVPGLFAANERVILWCENSGRALRRGTGRVPLNVASISLAWTRRSCRRGKDVTRIRYPADAPHLAIPPAACWGNSTSVPRSSSWRKGSHQWDAGRAAGRTVRMGERLASSPDLTLAFGTMQLATTSQPRHAGTARAPARRDAGFLQAPRPAGG